MKKFFLSYGLFLTVIAIMCRDTARPAEVLEINKCDVGACSNSAPFTRKARELETINLIMNHVKPQGAVGTRKSLKISGCSEYYKAIEQGKYSLL
ncbi:hypothetical protein ID47_05700 [Candidatus Paracaedibacter acanthamoebae]|uniref:Uncharacterized protein n=1 Tax=Candidatus Odyssella acanthamoebae TaxID=91604 RepID=A0A077AVA8_9PROT|nr:hypothetical protein ID47_05700 [Candidatus Paracaedibacter acanthamoebae]